MTRGLQDKTHWQNRIQIVRGVDAANTACLPPIEDECVTPRPPNILRSFRCRRTRGGLSSGSDSRFRPGGGPISSPPPDVSPLGDLSTCPSRWAFRWAPMKIFEPCRRGRRRGPRPEPWPAGPEGPAALVNLRPRLPNGPGSSWSFLRRSCYPSCLVLGLWDSYGKVLFMSNRGIPYIYIGSEIRRYRMQVPFRAL